MIFPLICCANNCNPPAFHTVTRGNGSLWQTDLTGHSQRRWKHARDSCSAVFNTEHSLSIYARRMCCGVWRHSVKVMGWHNICLLWMNVTPLYMDNKQDLFVYDTVFFTVLLFPTEVNIYNNPVILEKYCCYNGENPLRVATATYQYGSPEARPQNYGQNNAPFCFSGTYFFLLCRSE